jgi:hypothetical protein
MDVIFESHEEKIGGLPEEIVITGRLGQVHSIQFRGQSAFHRLNKHSGYFFTTVFMKIFL